MAFPDAERVIYDSNPIEEVICQFRFPTILRIEVEPPVPFQDLVRTIYPLYTSKPTLRLLPGLPQDLAALIAKDIPISGGQIAHEFTSRDGNWTLALTRDFLALKCRKYDRWENFKDHLHEPLAALGAVYEPAFFTRIGLRYRDLIRRSCLRLVDVPWSDLLTPWIAGALASPTVVDAIQRTAGELVIQLPDTASQILVHHGLVKDESSKENCYLIDADLFNEKQMERSNALGYLDFLNKQSRLFFRWCITDRLHNAMGPVPISGNRDD